MKRLFAILSMCTIGVFSVFAQNDTIVGWTFPGSGLSDTIADIHNNENTNSYIFTEGTSDISMKNGATSKAAQATEWQNGANVKSWQIKLNTSQYWNLALNAKITGGGTNPGPRDFKTQYKKGSGGTWTDIANGEITVANDWTTGVVSNLALPIDCEDQVELFVRFIMISDTALDGSIVISSGTSKIDDIYIIGTVISSLNDLEKEVYNIYPNPSNGTFFIESNEKIESINIYALNGQLLFSRNTINNTQPIDLDTPKGLYLVQIENSKNEIQVHQIVIK